jgi:tripeptide aminopeptidase
MSDVLDYFLKYVQIDSPSDPLNEAEVPSTPWQFDMARALAEDLRALGAEDVREDEHAYVTASIPASKGAEHLPALGLCSHIDVSYDCPGRGVKPRVVDYAGGNLVMGEVDGHVVQVTPDEVPELEKFAGSQIVCSDGSTLLGADDKAGVAEIMALAKKLAENPDLPHPCIKIAFVPDEEVGHGAELLDLDRFGAAWAYTVDGEQVGMFNYECFTASQVDVDITGVVVHPGDAKDRMVNALTVWRTFDSMLPANERPEHTAGYEGYYHALHIDGTPAHVTATYIVRDFDTDRFDARERDMQEIADLLNRRYGAETVKLDITEQYRNMAERFEDKRFLIDNAFEANRQAGVEPRAVAVRGGTDGAQLTFRGLPCPNIATGGFLFHSVREFIPVWALDKTVEILVNLVALFATEQK